jgi:hypothetical protein
MIMSPKVDNHGIVGRRSEVRVDGKTSQVRLRNEIKNIP